MYALLEWQPCQFLNCSVIVSLTIYPKQVVVVVVVVVVEVVVVVAVAVAVAVAVL